MTRREIRIAGYGGQGVITAGYVLAHAAVVYDGSYALMTQSYGPEARGGSCKSDVIVSTEPIDYPKVSRPGYMVVMSLDAFTTFGKTVSGDGVIIYEESLIKEPENSVIPGTRLIGVPAIDEAQELGNPLAANMVMLGAAQPVTMAVTVEALQGSIRDRFPRFVELNLEALRRGVEIGKKYA